MRLSGWLRRGAWRSPLRGPWLTSMLGLVLLAVLTVVVVSGFASHAAYEPGLPGNAIVPAGNDLPLLDGGWPTRPAWLYALSQGLHVNVGLVAIPVLLAKLWSVIPRLFTWPPAASVAQAVERAGIAVLVSSALFEFATGVCNAQNWYPFGFNFVVAHYYGAILFVASLIVHVAVKAPVVVRALRDRGVLAPLREPLARMRPEPAVDPDALAPRSPAPATLSRRGLFALVGAGSLTLLVANGGQTVGGPLRTLSLLAPRRAADFPVNKTARGAGIDAGRTGPGWRLQLDGPVPRALTREHLLALPQHTEELPIACVEGWSTTQRWTGVRLADLAALAGARDARLVVVESLQESGVLRRASLQAGQLADPRALLALRVNGQDLTLDHGYPARVIVPALPGVHCTKWVSTMSFRT